MNRYFDRCYGSVWAILAVIVVIGALTATGEIGGTMSALLKVSREGVRAGQLWRLVTYPFIASGAVSLMFTVIVFYYIAAPLELVWGTRRFLTLCGVSVIGGGVTAVLLDRPIAGGWAVGTTLMLIHGFMFPESILNIFFILPIRVKTLAILSTVVFLVGCVGSGVAGLALFAGLLCGVIYYVITTRSIPWIHRAARRVAAGALNPANILRSQSEGQMMQRARTIMHKRDGGATLDDDDRAFIEDLLRRADHAEQMCATYSFSPDNTICPPCKAFGRCLKRYLETDEEPVSEKKG